MMIVKDEKIEELITNIIVFVPIISALVCYFILIKSFDFNVWRAISMTVIWNISFFTMVKMQKYTEIQQETKKRVCIAVLLIAFITFASLLLIENKPSFGNISNIKAFVLTLSEVTIALLLFNAIIYVATTGIINLVCTGFVILYENKKLLEYIIVIISLIAMTCVTYLFLKPYTPGYENINKTLTIKESETSNICFTLPVIVTKEAKNTYNIKHISQYSEKTLKNYVIAHQEKLLKQKYKRNRKDANVENRITEAYLNKTDIYNTQFKLGEPEKFQIELEVGVYIKNTNKREESFTEYMDIYAVIE